MRLKTQLEAYQSVRKAPLPENRIQRPIKGKGSEYRRLQNNKEIAGED